jgi:hypothetical protein
MLGIGGHVGFFLSLIVDCSDAAPISGTRGRPSPNQNAACQRTTAAETLLATAHGFPMMMARISVLQAIHRNEVQQFNPDRKDQHWGNRKLKRDQ